MRGFLFVEKQRGAPYADAFSGAQCLLLAGSIADISGESTSDYGALNNRVARYNACEGVPSIVICQRLPPIPKLRRRGSFTGSLEYWVPRLRGGTTADV
jgi:hypothetical protein